MIKGNPLHSYTLIVENAVIVAHRNIEQEISMSNTDRIVLSFPKQEMGEAEKMHRRNLENCPIRFNGLPVSDERCGQFG